MLGSSSPLRAPARDIFEFAWAWRELTPELCGGAVSCRRARSCRLCERSFKNVKMSLMGRRLNLAATQHTAHH
jgi:hypothetical protein